ncbi:ABC-type nickel/cobalt efflux system permease component RcnA [Nocardioides thalensis]|uniref:Nickel/cobalt efflux system n=1 Tax=Nocardioides thalensis TaxID=1914755 RepID=A0A853C525_9ACTN|nr:ABC-type nickel/cobalt efflux system permease component RcnA [Nocardioides thalensis]
MPVLGQSPLLIDPFGASALGDRLVALVDAPGFVPAAFGLAFVAGAAHAVGPGHGKSLAAAYLVGSDGKVRDAAWLGLSVAVMHTVSVLVIAVAWTFFSLSDLVRLEHLTTALQLVGGVLVIGVGVWLFRRHLRAGAHGHGHGHSHGHTHTHEAPSRPGLVLLGMSGGLTPSPAAFLVLITGLFSGRSGFALLLVLTFGIGLASVLFAVGLLALTGRNVVVRAAESRRMFALATRVAPVLAAVSITLIGCTITSAAVHGLVVA